MYNMANLEKRGICGKCMGDTIFMHLLYWRVFLTGIMQGIVAEVWRNNKACPVLEKSTTFF